MNTLKRLLVVVALTGAAVASSGCSYNRFVSQEEAIKTQWAQVENQLQRRNDLIPNLVEATKGFAQQERDVFQAIADSRAKLAGAGTPEQKMAAANEQTSALARLLVVVENYPTLKSDATFARLMDELAGTENRIAVERMRYNEKVQAYNTSRRQFPANITAAIFGFKGDYKLFEAPEEAKVAPKVDFSRPKTVSFSGLAGPSGSPTVPTLPAFPSSKLMPVDDVVLATQGDTAAFERVYRAHMPRIFNLARRMAGPDAAEELTQDVFVRAWQKLALFRGESSFATWLHRLAVNVIIERFRTLGTARERFLADSEAVLEMAPARAHEAHGPQHGFAGSDRAAAARRPTRCSCCTTSRGTGTKRLATCSAYRRARRSRSCIARGKRCACC